MGARIVSLFVIVAMGVMLADALANPKGVKALFDGMGSLWKVSVNGMLGKPS
jgi:hypothetical protein